MSSSDFLQRCVPDAFVVRGLDIWHYAVVSLAFDSSQPPQGDGATKRNHDEDQHSTISGLHQLQVLLRQENMLSCIDGSKSQLWMFSRSPDVLEKCLDFDQETLSSLRGNPTVFHKDQFATAELLKEAHTATLQVAKPAQPAQPDGNASSISQKPEDKSVKHFRLLMTAISETLCHGLCAAHDVLMPIAFGLLALKPRRHSTEDSSVLHEAKDGEPVRFFRITPTLTLHGSLVLSVRQPVDHHFVQALDSEQLQLICIGPVGAWAYMCPRNDGQRTDGKGYHEEAFKGTTDMVWRSRVREYLAWRGYSAPESHSEQEWALIKLSKTSQMVLSWPACLCLAWNSEQHQGSDRHSWREWFTDDKARDALDKALDWLWSHDAAPGELENSQVPAEASDEMQMSLLFNQEPAGTSPTASRQAQYQDLSAAMVYPTPPDGMPAIAMLDASQTPSHDTPKQDSPYGMGSGLESSNADVQSGSLFDGSALAQASPTYADDLFGDASGLPDEADVTDADFNFFDETVMDSDMAMDMPIIAESHAEAYSDALQDIEMMGDPQNNASSLTQTHDEVLADATPTTLQKHVAFEIDEPLTASDSGQGPEDSVETPQQMELDGEPRGVELDLTPSKIQGGLSTQANESEGSRQFRAVNFNTDFVQSDSKYVGTGRFAEMRKRDVLKRSADSRHTALYDPKHLPWQPNIGFTSETHSKTRTRRHSSSSDGSGTDEIVSQHSYSSDGETPVDVEQQSPGHTRGGNAKNEVGHEQRDSTISRDKEMYDLREATLRSSILLCDYLGSYKSSVQNGPPPQMALSQQTKQGSAADNGNNGSYTMQEVSEMAQTAASYAGGMPCFRNMDWLNAVDESTENKPVASTSTLKAACLSHIIDRVFGEHTLVDDMASFAILDPTPILSSPRLGAPSPGRVQSSLLGEAIFEIPAPQIKVRRGGEAWCMEASALPFWDVLGVEPAHGPKDVVSHCIVPGTTSLMSACADFLEATKSQYEHAKLGNHQVGGLLEDFASGIIPSDASGVGDERGALERLEDTCHLFASILGRRVQGEQALVTYIINPFNSPEALAGVCRCCTTLQSKYREAVGVAGDATRPTRLVLVIVPIRLVAARSAPAFAEPDEMTQLARYVYDSVPQALAKRDLAISRAPAVELAVALRTRIPMELSERASADPQLEGCIMHLAYMSSSDSRWVVMAWTDDTGRLQHTSAYSLEGRSFVEVAYEAWLTTIEMMRARKVGWRLFVTSGAPMSLQEQRLWMKLATMLGSPQAAVRAALTLLSINVAPTLGASPSSTTTTTTSSASAAEGVATQQQVAAGAGPHVSPTSTPGPLGASPSLSTPPPATLNVGTPSSEAAPPHPVDADGNARLADSSDESWGVILSHALGPLGDSTVCAPARMSGYLAKRRSRDERDEPVMMEVNLLHCADRIEAGESALIRNDKTLREVLVSYRGLSVLARLRGLHDGSSTEPWHVAAARRGAELLAKGAVSPNDA